MSKLVKIGPPTHQTIRLSPGAHPRPQDGACVVELASMLSDQPFSDRPRTVCPALREFLHGYNDSLDDELRLDLYGLAAAIVDTRATALTTAWRGRMCVDWGRSLTGIEQVTIPFWNSTLADCALAGEYCARLALRDRWFHERTIGFFTWLAGRRRPQPAAPLPASRRRPSAASQRPPSAASQCPPSTDSQRPLQRAALLGQTPGLAAVAGV